MEDDFRRDTFTWYVIQTKWRNLTATFKRIKESNRTSGSGRSQWQFYDEINEIVFRSPDITPVALSTDSVTETGSGDTTASTFSQPNKRPRTEFVSSAQMEIRRLTALEKIANCMETMADDQNKFTDVITQFLKKE